jgi:hypothetical protein
MLLPITDGDELTESMSRRAGRETWLTGTGPFPDGHPLAGGVGVVVVVPVVVAGAAAITALGTEVALFEPELFDAVTRTRTVLPTSLLASV